MSKYSSSINNLLHIKQSTTDKYIAICNDRDTSIINLDNTNIKAQFRVLDDIWTPTINLNNIFSTYDCNIINIGSNDTILNFNNKVGIGTDNPIVSLDISYKTDALKLPKGNNLERSNINANDVSDRGLIRYNTELDQFEGYGAGNAWGSLGGVIDINQDTYIIAESNAENNDELQFYTAGDQRMIIKDDGKIGIGTHYPTHKLHVEGDTFIEGNLIVNGTQVIINTSTTDQILIKNSGTSTAFVVNQIGNKPIVDIQYNSNTVLFIENGGKVGIGTDNPAVSLDISYKTDALKLPKGNNLERSNINANDVTDRGLIRYNTELDQFEGYGAGNAWGSLGGVIDIDQDTYIIAESNAENNNELQFYTAGDERMIIKDDGKIGIGTSTPSVLLDIYDCNEHILKVGHNNIEISRSIIPSNSNVDIGDPENQIRDMYVSDNSLWIGDTHKISHSDGKLKFRKRKTTNIPDVILDLPLYSESSELEILQAISTFFTDNSLLTVSNITLKHWLGFYREQKGANRTISIQEIFRDNADDYDEETAADAWLVSRTDDIYLGNDYGKIGIGTAAPNVSLDISYRTDAIKLPKGNTTDRNAIGANGIEDQGLIRYNTELQQFEGYGAGNAWGSLGGVIDIDQDTYIIAESNAENNNELQFYTAGDERMIIKNDGKIGIGTDNPSNKLHVEGDIKLTGNLYKNNVLFSTDDLIEGTSNLYYSEDRVDSNIATKNTDNLTEGSSNKYYTENRVNTNILNKNIYCYNSNIGIGIIPTEKLDINGNAVIRNNLIVNGDILVDNGYKVYPTVSTKNLIREYKFDRDYIDSSGNNNNLIISSVSTPTVIDNGITGNALRFQNNIDTTIITNGLRDGTCKIPAIDLVNKEFSISFWIKLLNNFDTEHSGIFMLGYNEGLQTDGYIKLSCAYYESKNMIDFYYKQNITDVGGNASTDLSINTWYNITITITNSYLKVYTNNILTSTKPLVEELPTVIYDTNYLGFYNDSIYVNTKDDFLIDSLSVYDKKLTISEISNLYNHYSFVIPYSLYTDTTHSLQSLAEFKTGVNGWRIVRFLPSTSSTWHPTNDNLAGITPYGTAYDYNVAWSVAFGNFDEFVFSTKGLNHWLQVSKFEAIGEVYSNDARTIIKSSVSPTSYTANWYNRTNTNEQVDPWIGLRSHQTAPANDPENGGDLILYAEASFGNHWSIPAISIDGGICVFVRSSTDIETVNPVPEYKTLTFEYKPNDVIIQYEENTDPNTWDEANIFAINKGGRLPTKQEMIDWLDVNGRISESNMWAPIYDTTIPAPYKHWIQVGIELIVPHHTKQTWIEGNSSLEADWISNNLQSSEAQNYYFWVLEQSEYTVNFPETTTCDILIVGGGGAGGNNHGGGGGGGAVIYCQNKEIPSGNYTIKVGNGGNTNQGNGTTTEAFNVIADGGGGGGKYNGITGNNGGSGGGAPYNSLNSGNSIITDNSLTDLFSSWGGTNNVYGGDGNNGESSSGGGGGGAGGSVTSVKTNGNDGIQINIDGNNYYWAGGGGGYSEQASGQPFGGNGGLGGGGGAGHYNNPEVNDGVGGTGGINLGGDGGEDLHNANTIGGNGGAHTGSGGGGGHSGLFGSGGSGIVIIKYLVETVSQTIIESYSDNKVEQVLENKGGTNITWNLTTKVFDCDLVKTDDLIEGTSNLYYTDDRVNTNISKKNIFAHNSNIGIGIQPTEKLDIDGNVLIRSNLRVQGDILIDGDFSNIETHVQVTDQFKVENSGTGPALVVNQTGSNNIIDIQDEGISVLFIKDGGNVGIGTTSPSHKLDVNGDIRTIGQIFCQSIIFSDDNSAILSANNISTNILNIASNTSAIAVNTSNIASLAPVANSGNYNDLINPPIMYTDADVSNLLSTSAGFNISWNNITNKFDNPISQYTDSYARMAIYPINQVNSGSTLVNGGINIFDKNLWFNSTDGQRRLQFQDNADTVIHCPTGINNNICLRHNGSDRFRTGETLNKSIVSMEIGPSPYNSSPLKLTMRGVNNASVSSAIVFADSGNAPYYAGMIIYYDSFFNKLKISADLNDDGNIDLEPAVTIQREDRYVGILKSSPVYPLDVVGDIQTSTTIRTPRIDFADGTNITTMPTLQALLTANSDDINDVDNINFTDPLAFIRSSQLQLNGTGVVQQTAYETETFTNAAGGTNITMSGFNTNLFTNGSIGSANAVGGFGQINGISESTISQVKASSSGYGSSGDFDSLTSTGFSNYFIFNGGQDRLLRTKDISTLLPKTNTISFNYIVGSGNNGGNSPESLETLYIEFLSNTGSSITKYTIHSGGNGYAGGTNFTPFQHTLSATDKTATYVRWIQNKTSTGNFDHYGITNIVFTYTETIASTIGLFLKGPNSDANSSVVCFGDNGTGNYYGGMTINYDSVDKKLQFGADLNDDGIIDTDSGITILRSNKYVGVLNNVPVYPLDVVGDIQTSTTIRTPKVDFNDGTSLTSASTITTNTSNILTNTNNIATNTTNITKNTSNINLLQKVATTGDYNDLFNQPTLFNLETHNIYSYNSNIGIGIQPTEKLDIDGNVLIRSNLRVQGDILIDGDFSNIETHVQVTDQFKVENSGTGPALVVNQTGSNNIIDIQDEGISVLFIKDGGNVGIGTTSPSHKLDVNGDIKFTGNIYKNNSLFTTDNLTEGSNLYYTETLFNTSLSNKTTNDLTEGSNLYYTETLFDTSLSNKTTNDLTEGSNLYYTETLFNTSLSNKTTNDLTEGSNLYYSETLFDTSLASKNIVITKIYSSNIS